MNIGAAARRAGLPVKTIHYYESIGLIEAGRKPNGYRDYDEPTVQKLRFVQRARSLGFSIEECRNLLSLYQDRRRASKDVKSIAEAKLQDIDAKIAALESLRHALAQLVHSCQGGRTPRLPDFSDLAGEGE